MADSTKAKKNYVKGGSKKVTFSNGGHVVHLDIKIDGKIHGSNGPIFPNEKGYAKITISELPAPDQYGNTHAVYENEFKPDKEKAKKAQPRQEPKNKIDAPLAKVKTQKSSDDLPF